MFLTAAFCRISAFSALLAVLAGSASAAMVTPGSLHALSGTTSAANPALGGTVQDDPLRPFEIQDAADNVLLTGNLQDRVSLSDDLGTLIFSPRLRELSGFVGAAPPQILSMTISGYSGYSTEIEYRTDGSGDVGPDSVSRSADGDLLTFRYSAAPLLPPDSSHFLSILTDATAFAPIGSATILARVGVDGPVFQTTIQGINVPVPEPTSAVVMLGGLAAVSTGRRRR